VSISLRPQYKRGGGCNFFGFDEVVMLAIRVLSIGFVIGLCSFTSSAKADSFLGGYSSRTPSSVQKLERIIHKNNSDYIAMTRSCSSHGSVVRTVTHKQGMVGACDSGQGKIVVARSRARELCSGGKSGPRCACADTAVLCKKA
jgi:hypothetical protein